MKLRVTQQTQDCRQRHAIQDTTDRERMAKPAESDLDTIESRSSHGLLVYLLSRRNAPKITKGAYAVDIARVDHLISRSVATGLDERLYNLEFMPNRMNTSKGVRIGQRQVALANERRRRGVISDDDFQNVMSAQRNLR